MSPDVAAFQADVFGAAQPSPSQAFGGVEMLAHRVVFPEANRVAIEEQELGEPGAGEVLLRTLVSLITPGTELTLLDGCHAAGTFWSQYGCYPVYPGFGQVSEVVAVGTSVSGLAVGDRVLSSRGHRSAEIVTADRVRLLPPEVFADEAVFHTIASGVINSIRVGEVSLGDSVVVVGLGLLGQFAVRLARLAGARPVIGVDPRAERRLVASQGGATATLAPQVDILPDVVAELTQGRRVDVVFEMTGDATAIPVALGLVRPHGRYVQVGCPRGKSEIDFNDAVLVPGLHIVGSLFSRQPDQYNPDCNWTSERGVDLFLRLIEEGALDLQSLISHRISWREAPKAYETLREKHGRALGVLIDWAD